MAHELLGTDIYQHLVTMSHLQPKATKTLIAIERKAHLVMFFFFFLMAVCLHAAAHCKSLKGHQHRNASQFTPTKGKKDGDSLSHIHSYPFSLLLYSTSSTRMLAVALIRAVNQ